MAPKERSSAPCQEIVWEGDDVDLSRLPVQTCWPGDVAPLITWGLTVTRGPEKTRQNLGIYRQQVLAPNKVIMRWLRTRGGALDFRDHAKRSPGTPFPIAVALGADPATILGAVTPVPDTLSEYQFAGLLRGARTEIVKCLSHGLQVPASAEIVLEGFIRPDANDPTGYETAWKGRSATTPATTTTSSAFPCSRSSGSRCAAIRSITRPTPASRRTSRRCWASRSTKCSCRCSKSSFRRSRISTCRPRAAATGWRWSRIKKQYAGHAKRVMFGVWSFLRQFMYTKFIVVTDDDVNVRDWKEVVWAISTRVDPQRDTLIVPQTPIDYLDFASARWQAWGARWGSTRRTSGRARPRATWGTPIAMDAAVKARVDALWKDLGL